eukprot:gb/GECG01002451.1/.p1 GENE.gb/GECG01002451.1/~~gb/GECG01002451.1/.p1  ORF type:complete len:140 (+),score=6.92 gb/GECG01002451.1/:1-420(+)
MLFTGFGNIMEPVLVSSSKCQQQSRFSVVQCQPLPDPTGCSRDQNTLHNRVAWNSEQDILQALLSSDHTFGSGDFPLTSTLNGYNSDMKKVIGARMSRVKKYTRLCVNASRIAPIMLKFEPCNTSNEILNLFSPPLKQK